MTQAKCANCDWQGEADDCRPIADIYERVTPGETMPAGECPECGCLAHTVEREDTLRARTIRPASYDQLERMRRIGDDLRLALQEAKICEAPRLAAKLRSAIKSQGGALRHMENRILRTSQK